MSISALRRRPDQVEELTRGLDLPLSPIADPLMKVLVESISAAFEGIRESWPDTVATGTEPEVTALLISRLNSMTESMGLWRSLVRCVGRGDECISFDGRHLEKQPDLSIWLTNRSARFPLLAEAKIIDGPNGKTEALYCSHGLHRFLVGQYGWGSREALMLGYVRDAATIQTRLAPYLENATHALTYAVEEGAIAVGAAATDCSRSRHSRSFVYSHLPDPKNLPGQIELWHLWLQAA